MYTFSYENTTTTTEGKRENNNYENNLKTNFHAYIKEISFLSMSSLFFFFFYIFMKHVGQCQGFSHTIARLCVSFFPATVWTLV